MRGSQSFFQPQKVWRVVDRYISKSESVIDRGRMLYLSNCSNGLQVNVKIKSMLTKYRFRMAKQWTIAGEDNPNLTRSNERNDDLKHAKRTEKNTEENLSRLEHEYNDSKNKN
jgi:hypothetical protein